MVKDEKIEVIDLFIRWFNNYLGNIGNIDEEFESLSSLKEVSGMLATSLEVHDRKIADSARQEGIERGIEKGKKEGLMDSVNRLRGKGISILEISELLDIPVEDIGKE
ncbi:MULTISPECIES: hypothetical protein [unclassified Oceanispirochaeta]|uniref:hypothetical protein n=1 Tax=unclassified Oceanispirochaeta TaxID=2635722 RepID=UPI000E090DFB|nr:MULTISPECIES: hypothetical protein [unclassified Oceanispirochaeta]MBF9018784.1 hypothetical protein [Oceanispirochaeta sp. M2]NPD75253.1 hypothetical protein [Oceanispirochaeta sp. M1]RDG28890.1 hypothetical protein DV872_24475 [Oceanispirochaeta sp. M1]